MQIGVDAIAAGADEPGMHAADPQPWSKRSAAHLSGKPQVPLLADRTSDRCQPSLFRANQKSSPQTVDRTSGYNPAIAFHRFAKSVRSFDVMSRAMASRLRMAVSGKMSGSSARAAVSSSLAEARMSWAAGTGQT